MHNIACFNQICLPKSTYTISIYLNLLFAFCFRKPNKNPNTSPVQQHHRWVCCFRQTTGASKSSRASLLSAARKQARKAAFEALAKWGAQRLAVGFVNKNRAVWWLFDVFFFFFCVGFRTLYGFFCCVTSGDEIYDDLFKTRLPERRTSSPSNCFVLIEHHVLRSAIPF